MARERSIGLDDEAAEPTSWLLVEEGWRVVGRDGDDLGDVAEVLGDQVAGIFDGIQVRGSALAVPRYVPAEDVAAIRDGVIEIRQASLDEPVSEAPPGGVS
jgi:hypothetical protein